MAGIYDRITPSSTDRVPVHILYASLSLYAEGDITRSQALEIINSTISIPLNAVEQNDMSLLANNIDLANANNKLRYLHLVHAYFIMVEMGVSQLTELVLRTRLNIVV